MCAIIGLFNLHIDMSFTSIWDRLKTQNFEVLCDVVCLQHMGQNTSAILRNQSAPLPPSKWSPHNALSIWYTCKVSRLGRPRSRGSPQLAQQQNPPPPGLTHRAAAGAAT